MVDVLDSQIHEFNKQTHSFAYQLYLSPYFHKLDFKMPFIYVQKRPFIYQYLQFVIKNTSQYLQFIIKMIYSKSDPQNSPFLVSEQVLMHIPFLLISLLATQLSSKNPLTTFNFRTLLQSNSLCSSIIMRFSNYISILRMGKGAPNFAFFNHLQVTATFLRQYETSCSWKFVVNYPLYYELQIAITMEPRRECHFFPCTIII